MIPDFNKNSRSYRVHAQTASHHYEFALRVAGSVSSWLRSSNRSQECFRLADELQLLVQELYDNVLVPLAQPGISDHDVTIVLDRACQATQEIRNRIDKLRDFAQKNKANLQEFLADTGNNG